jgi:hypothetical protein
MMKWFHNKLRSAYDDTDIAEVVVAKTELLYRGRDPENILCRGNQLLPLLLGVTTAVGDTVLDFGGAAGLHCLVASKCFPERKFRWALSNTAIWLHMRGSSKLTLCISLKTQTRQQTG